MQKLLIGAVLAAVAAVSANATVILTLGNTGGQNENVLLGNGTTGTTVQGSINGVSDFLVDFTSSQTLTEPSNGQARVEAVSGGLTNITISLTNGFTYGGLIFNPFIGGTVGTGGPATISGVASEPGGGTSTFSFDTTFGNGNNFITLSTAGGESIISTTITQAAGFSDLRQVRIIDATQGGQQEAIVPEPASMILISCGMIGLGLLRKRK